MKMEQFVIQGIKAEELLKRFDKFDERFDLITKLLGNSNLKNSEENYLSRKEVCTILKISLPTLNDWSKKGLLISYRIGTRVLYKTLEVSEALRKRNFRAFNAGQDKTNS